MEESDRGLGLAADSRCTSPETRDMTAASKEYGKCQRSVERYAAQNRAGKGQLLLGGGFRTDALSPDSRCAANAESSSESADYTKQKQGKRQLGRNAGELKHASNAINAKSNNVEPNLLYRSPLPPPLLRSFWLPDIIGCETN